MVEVSPSAAAGGFLHDCTRLRVRADKKRSFNADFFPFTFSEQLQGFVPEPASFLIPLKERCICHQLSSREY